MKLEIETSAFNDRRYGKPWIAAVSFANGAKADFTFGDWIGSHGSSGLLILDNVKPGDVIARGQKDNRGQAYKSSPDYYQVDAEGELNGLPTPAAAYKAWRENEAAKKRRRNHPMTSACNVFLSRSLASIKTLAKSARVCSLKSLTRQPH